MVQCDVLCFNMVQYKLNSKQVDITHLSCSPRIALGRRGHLSAHASEGQCVEYAIREILAKLKIELSVNI